MVQGTIDTAHGLTHDAGAGLTLIGRARDLATGPSGTATDHHVVAEASVTASVDPGGTLVSLDASAPVGEGDTAALLGRAVSAGFRDAVHLAFPDDVAAGTPLALLLDDLPVAALDLGYALLYQGMAPADRAKTSMKSDICSGWRADGTMMTSVDAGQGVPVTVGPRAPAISDEAAHDPVGWHAIGELPIGSMRRRRLVDVLDAGDSWAVIALFRDTHVDQSGIETVLHEYSLTATVDPATREFTSCRAVPRCCRGWSARWPRRAPIASSDGPSTAFAITCGRRCAVRPRAPTSTTCCGRSATSATLVRVLTPNPVLVSVVRPPARIGGGNGLSSWRQW